MKNPRTNEAGVETGVVFLWVVTFVDVPLDTWETDWETFSCQHLQYLSRRCGLWETTLIHVGHLEKFNPLPLNLKFGVLWLHQTCQKIVCEIIAWITWLEEKCQNLSKLFWTFGTISLQKGSVLYLNPCHSPRSNKFFLITRIVGESSCWCVSRKCETPARCPSKRSANEMKIIIRTWHEWRDVTWIEVSTVESTNKIESMKWGVEKRK